MVYRKVDTGTGRQGNFGSLDGKSIVRFTHITDAAAGMEMHLDTLNRILLDRNRLTIFQFYMPDHYTGIETQQIGKGTLIKIPLKFKKKEIEKERLHNKIIRHLWYLFASHDCYNPYYRSAVDFEKIVVSFFEEHTVDIATNHFLGGFDSLIFMKEAVRREIPVCAINHFNNQWFRKNVIRKQLHYSKITAGLSNVNVPRFLKRRFVNISNGIDTDFFNPEILTKIENRKNILLLPARIVLHKGHYDLLVIINNLKKEGIDCLAVFAGKIYNVEYKKRLDTFIEKNNLGTNVLFTGQLSQESLRQWYRDSTLLVFPTTHDEGLPRVVIEAQAMKTPPICYAAGGTSEALLSDTTGYITGKNERTKMQKYIIELLHDEKKREALGVAGRAFVIEKFSLTAMARRHEQLYMELLGG